MDRLLSSWAERSQPVEQDVDVAERVRKVERFLERGGTEVDVRIGLDARAKVLALVPGPRGVSLYEPVGLVPVVARGDERAEHSLAEHEPAGRVEVGAHVRGVDDDPFCPRPNGSWTSPSSVRARWRISVAKRSSDAAHSASVESSSA